MTRYPAALIAGAFLISLVSRVASADVNTYVRPATPGEFEFGPFHQQSYPPFTDHPDTPDQSDFTLNAGDTLAAVLPGGSPSFGLRDSIVSRAGGEITIDTFVISTGVVGNAIYGPIDAVYAIDPLPAGTYSLTVRQFFVFDSNVRREDFPSFVADPAGYASARNLHLFSSENLAASFTVVPEPASVAVLTLPLLQLLRRRARKGGG